MKNLVTTDWLENNINNVRILDASWHMPNSKRNSLKEFLNNHIENANFFDLDKTSDQNSSLPHMLPSKNSWERIVSEFGIKNSDHVVIYDNSDVISSCRIWYNFLYFNHDPNYVSVLDGGLKKWIKENKKTTKRKKIFTESSYSAKENLTLVLNKNQININIKNKAFELIDARSKERFEGLQPEPRRELNSGNIEGSKNLPFMELINKSDNTFKNKKELITIFKNLSLDPSKNIAFTCGSGVTACILGLANSIISGKNPNIYDGSWSEYGIKQK
jgi:thiosulfate/3-mercaptopyruvate sulfurtransferase